MTYIPPTIFGVISTANSSAVALGISGVFTGTSEDISEYVDVRVTVFTDQASATDGLQLQQSSNGTNWDNSDSYSIPASTGKTFSVAATANFFRVVYTNGVTAQTAFRLQTKYHRAYSKGSSVRPQDARANDNDMEEVLGHNMLFNGASWDRARGTVANGALTDVSRIVAALPTGANVIGGVTGTFWQVTQPVSLATLPVTNAGTFAVQAAATLAAETTKVIGTVNVSAAQTLATVTTVSAVTAITNALPVGANVIGALTANQSVNIAQMGGVATTMGSGVTGTGVQRVVLATDVILPAIAEIRAATLHVTATAAANTAITATLPAVAGQFHYITSIHLMRTATAALAGTATLIHTTANLPGSPAWSVGNAMVAGGTQLDLNYTPTTPLKSSVVNTATTITMPAGGAAVLNRINVSYFTAA